MSFAIRNWLPNVLKNPLWGNRKRWGLEVKADDSYCGVSARIGGLLAAAMNTHAGYQSHYSLPVSKESVMDVR